MVVPDTVPLLLLVLMLMLVLPLRSLVTIVTRSRGLDGAARTAAGRGPYVPSFTAVPTNRYGRTTTDLKTKRVHCG